METTKNKTTKVEVSVSKNAHELEENVLKHHEHKEIKTGQAVLFFTIEETKRQGSRIRALD